METTPEQIDQWRSLASENQNLEFKEAKTQFDFNKLCRYCVAIANEGGGTLLFGIADKLPRPVTGSKAVENPQGMAEKIFENLGFRVDIEAVEHPDGRVVVFHVPSRPRGTAYQHKGSYLMRSGEQLCPMSEDQLRRIFAEGEPNWLEEHSQVDVEPQKVIELLDTQTFFELIQRPYPTTRDAVLDQLEQERLIDVHNGRYSIRRLTALLLAKRLDHFPSLSRKATRIVVYNGNSKLETRLDHVEERGYAVGFQKLIEFVMSQLPQQEAIKKGLRREAKLVPEIVIRELAANALIHQDFTIGGSSVMIEVYQDRVEISNPGEPLVPIERFIDGYLSRNERMADLMRRMGICEEKSSGIDKVIHAAEQEHLSAPDFRTIYRRTVAVVFGSKNFADMDRAERIRACYQHCAWKWVMNDQMTNKSLRERFHLPEEKSSNVSQIISAAIDAGAIKPDKKQGSSKRLARYLPFWA